MSNCFILLAAGKGKRFKSKIPKQFLNYKNKPLYMHSLEKALESNLFKKVIIVSNLNLKIKNKIVSIIKGGKERYLSSKKALEYIKNKKIKTVFIHDAARPNFSINLLKRLLKYSKKNKAVVPYINSTNSVKYKKNSKIINLDRNNVFFTQTPQCFNFTSLYNLTLHNKNIITDEASLFLDNNKKVKFIKGEDSNIKITTKLDYSNLKKETLYGIGFDIHKLVLNKKLYLGGIKIPFHSGLEGHSDGDVILHSIIDSLLGALRKKDIGIHFPNTKKEIEGIRSTVMLKKVLNMLIKNNFSVNNIDINLICEKPKVNFYRNKIINSLSNLLSLDKSKINLKGKTVEKLGIIGKEKAIACEVISSIIR